MGKKNVDDEFNNLKDYEISTIYNDVTHAAEAYLMHAERAFEFENNKTNFLDIQYWYVPQHLSYISTELYLKSFYVKNHIIYTMYDEGTEYQDVDVEVINYTLKGHGQIIERYPLDIKEKLIKYLNEKELTLIQSMSTKEFSKSRYYYEKDVTYINGEVVLNWLSLARRLSKFIYKRNS